MKIKDLSKRILAFMLMTMLLIGSFPVNVSADTVSETPVSYFKYTKLRVNSRSPYTGVRIDGFEYRKSEKDLVIPNVIEGLPVVEIKASAFRKANIDSLILNKNLEKVGASAFAYNNISKLIMEEGVESLGDSAFYDNKLSEIRLPESVKIIGASAFKLNLIKEFDIAKMAPGVEEIGRYAFGVHYAKDSVLDKLVINDELLDLFNSMSSKRCGAMKDILYRQTPKTIIIETSKLEKLDKKIFTSLISSALVNEVKDVVISDSVKFLGQGTFDKFGYKNVGEENEVVFTVLNPDMEFEIGCRGNFHYEKKYTPFAWLEKNNVVLVSYNDSTSRKFVEYFDGLLPEEKLGRCVTKPGNLKDRLEFRGILDISRTIDGKDIERTDIKVNDEFSYNVKMSLGGFLEGTSVELVEEFHELFKLKSIEVKGITEFTEHLDTEKAIIEIPVNNNTMEKDIEVIFTGSLSMPKDEKTLDIVSKSELRGNRIKIDSNETVIKELITDNLDTAYTLKLFIDGDLYDEFLIPAKTGVNNIPNYLEDVNKIQSAVVYEEKMYDPRNGLEIMVGSIPRGDKPLSINPDENVATLDYIGVPRYGMGRARFLDEDGKDLAERIFVYGDSPFTEFKTVYAKDIDGYKLAKGQANEFRLVINLNQISEHDFIYVKEDKADNVIDEPLLEEVIEEEVEEVEILEEVDELEEMEEEVSETEIVEVEENDPNIFKTYNISKDEVKILGFAKGKAVKNLIIPEEIDGKIVTEISYSAFKHEKLDSLALPRTLKKIDKYAFAYNNLQEVELPENIEVISSYAFMANVGLEVFNLENASYVSPYAFIYNK